MIICVRICPILSAYIYIYIYSIYHKTIILLCEDLYHTSIHRYSRDTICTMGPHNNHHERAELRRSHGSQHCFCWFHACQGRRSQGNCDSLPSVATASNQERYWKDTVGKKSQQLLICSFRLYLSLSHVWKFWEWNIMFLLVLSSVYVSSKRNRQEKKHQATWGHDFFNRIEKLKNPVLLVEVASIPVKGMKLCICTS